MSSFAALGDENPLGILRLFLPKVNPEGPERDPKKTEERVNVKGSDTRDDVYTQWELVCAHSCIQYTKVCTHGGQVLAKHRCPRVVTST